MRRLVWVWATCTCSWLLFVSINVWLNLSDVDRTLSAVSIVVEKPIAYETLFGSSGWNKTAPYPVAEFDASSPQFREAREHFPSFMGKPDEELLAHLKRLITAEVRAVRRYRKS